MKMTQIVFPFEKKQVYLTSNVLLLQSLNQALQSLIFQDKVSNYIEVIILVTVGVTLLQH